MGLKKLFKTNGTLESCGVVIDYDGETRIRIARAGGHNKKYIKAVEKELKPFRRAIAAGQMSNTKATELLSKVFAETVILGWEVNRGGQWLAGIDPEDAGESGAELLQVNAENIQKVFKNLPELFADLQQQASSISLFREEIAEADSGN